MGRDAWFDGWRAALRRSRSPAGPTCKVTLDLRGVPWGTDPDKASRLLKRQPGVIDVRVDTRRRRAVVLHDPSTSLPQLWNWLMEQSTVDPGPGTRR